MTPTTSGERTHPATPESPTLYFQLQSNQRRALRREPAVIFHVDHQPEHNRIAVTTPSFTTNLPTGNGSGPQVTSIQPAHADVDSSFIPTFYPPDVSDFLLFLKLDSYTEPGLSEVQFQNLFAKCLGCGLYMTRRTVDFHACGGDGGSSSATWKVLEVIDLTTVEDS